MLSGSTIRQYIEAYSNREVAFQFRKRTYNFSLSHGLFSSADIDTGSRFLLKVFSAYLDEHCLSMTESINEENSFSILDAGSGCGVLGIIAAGTLKDLFTEKLPVDIKVRSQDRDELARIFTAHNAEKNGISAENLEAFTEPLLAGQPGQKWDFILTNIPAKAGLPVLEDFISRSAGLLKKDGKVFLVAVHTLADFFRAVIKTSASLLHEEKGKEHTVFVYTGVQSGGAPAGGPSEAKAAAPKKKGSGFFWGNPAYLRTSAEYEMEETSYHIDAVYGASDFDNPGGETEAAAKLMAKLISKETNTQAVLIHEGGPGHFPVWLISKLKNQFKGLLVLSGRNILALEAARHNCLNALEKTNPENSKPEKAEIKIIPSVDLAFDKERLQSEAVSGYSLIAAFPELVPQTNRLDAIWEGMNYLLAPGGLAVLGFPSTEAGRFDRKKPAGFTRAGDIKRKGFRALAYKRY
jgi:hypothetical protein